jgi:hypothetical protein
MTQVEILLSVDAGNTPPGVVAFFVDDGDRVARRAQASIAVVLGLLAGACAWIHAGRAPVTLLLLAAGMLALRAMRTLPDDETPTPTRQVLVVTSLGLIVRDARGLRSWLFENLIDVVAGIYNGHPYLDLIDQNGIRHSVSCLPFRRGERARRVISARLLLKRTPAG